MLDLLLRGARTGVVTTGYPAVVEPAPAAFRGQVTLALERCTGDGACARVCPSAAIAVAATAAGGWTWHLDDARCVFCGLCAEVCPSTAIALSTEFELAVREAAALQALVRFAPASAAGDDGRKA